ncbi:glycosyl hydrolase family 47 protein [Thozetella sp. PMI_491]|nr:glycosyl hydrolase family 47 protein [Thozetella sp. PMI_491]
MATRRKYLLYFVCAATAFVVLLLGWSRESYLFPTARPKRPSDGFIWRDVEPHYPLTSFRPLPTGKPRHLPPVQAKFPIEVADAKETRLRRQGAVKDVFIRCWKTYKEFAWLRDEVRPVSGKPKDAFGGWGATLIDSLDTLWIMGLREEFDLAVDAIHQQISFNTTTASEISVFETSIRLLGGLLSAYDLSGDQRLLSKARDVGDMLDMAFDTPSRIPSPRWDIHAAARGVVQPAPDFMLLAELGSYTMEFTRLSLLTKDPKYYESVARITDLLHETQMKTKLPGLWPTKVGTTARTLDKGDEYTLGAEADSAIEYTAKMIALLGGQLSLHEDMYLRSVDAAASRLFYRPLTPDNEDVLLSGTVRIYGSNEPKLETSAQHLSCFAGGMLALGGRLVMNESHVELAKKLTHGCVWLYRAGPIGVMPEACSIAACPKNASSCDWNENSSVWHAAIQARYGSAKPVAEIIAEKRLLPGFIDLYAPSYNLRPEAIESVFLLYRVTAEPSLMDRAWEMWTAIVNATTTELANSAVVNVSPEAGQRPKLSDSMESFWLSETLKYFYLVFSEPELINLDEWVFSTEAHPFRREAPAQ